MAKRYPGIECAHVWNSQSESEGQNSNGQFYFTGRTIYSYGSHFPIAWIAPDGAALFNAAGYSPTTGKHQSYAAQAASNRPRVYLPDFRALHESALRWIKSESDGAAQRDAIRHYIKEHAAELAEARFGNSRWFKDGDGESAGAYLTRLAGLPAASWPKLEREGRKLAEREAKAAAKRKLESDIASAKRVAEMPDATLKANIRQALGGYNAEYALKRSANEARVALITANKAGFSKRRVESIRNAKRLIVAALNDCERLAELVKRRKQTRLDIATMRLTAKRGTDRPRDVAEAAERLSRLGLLPFTARRQLALVAEHATEAAKRLELERIARENARKAEQIAAWRSGAAGYVRFDAPSGGAALRIAGDTLETSHGASVPLAHAVRVFRFVKLCKERGESWQRNGRTIRVGHYQVDSVGADGSFVAGCHHFTWPEIEAAAKQAGVVDAPADASAVELKGVA